MQVGKRFHHHFCRPAVLAALALGLFTGCLENAPDDDSADTGETAQDVVYGIDNRQDLFAHSDPSLRSLTERAGVVLMSSTWSTRAIRIMSGSRARPWASNTTCARASGLRATPRRATVPEP